MDELEALELIFGDSDAAARLETTTPRAIERARSAVSAGTVEESLEVGEVGLKVTLGTSVLFVTMPAAYPAGAALQLSVTADGESRSEELAAIAREAARDAGEGAESALPAIQAFVDAASEYAAADDEAADHAAEAASAAGPGRRGAASAAASRESLRLSGGGACWLDLPADALAECGMRPGARVWRGDELVDRRSVFQAFAVAAEGPGDAASLVRLLLRDKRVRKATHNMMAFRAVRPEDGVMVSDNDEDGEAGAGSRMSHLLEMMGATGAAVVVSRWYGGILLGPKRFAHISNCTREALEQSGICPRN